MRKEAKYSPMGDEIKYPGLPGDIAELIIRLDKNLHCITINAVNEKSNGFNPEATIGKDYRELGMPQGLVSVLDKGIKRAISTGLTQRFNSDIPAVFGEKYYQHTIIPEFTENGCITSFIWIMRTSDRQPETAQTLLRANEALEAKVKEHTAELSFREQQITRIFETTAEGILLVDIGGDIIRANAAAIRILKLDPNKLNEQSLHLPYWEIPAQWTIVNPDGSPMNFKQNPLARAISHKQITNNVEFGIKFDDGSLTWVNTSTAPFINDQGRVEGIVFTFIDITEQKSLRDEKEQFTKKLIEVQEEERSRISRELHDDTAQWLALLTLEIDDIIVRGKDTPPNLISRLQKLRLNTDKALQEVRRFSHELRPSVLEHFGIASALELIVSEFEDINSGVNIKASLEIRGTDRRLPKEAELVLFRVAQESLNNIRKHAQATSVEVILEYRPDMVSLTVTDDGRGFKPVKKNKPANSRIGGLGLVGMRERAHLIGGHFSITSALGEGTTVSLIVPVKSCLSENS